MYPTNLLLKNLFWYNINLNFDHEMLGFYLKLSTFLLYLITFVFEKDKIQKILFKYLYMIKLYGRLINTQ